MTTLNEIRVHLLEGISGYNHIISGIQMTVLRFPGYVSYNKLKKKQLTLVQIRTQSAATKSPPIHT